MHNDSFRRRLEVLNRGPLPAEEPRSVVAPRATPRAARRRQSNAPPGLALPSIAGLVQSGERVETSIGEHWCVRLPLEALWSDGAKLVSARQEHLHSQLLAGRQAIEPNAVIDQEFTNFIAALPDRALALDLETCGLSGAALFLVGLLRQIDGVPTIELLLARNYAEEAAVLESLWKIVAGHDVLVTFNGRTFDWPMVLERSIRHRLRGEVNRPLHHIDVLHHARQRWRTQLPNCRLQTLERHICRRHRPADIPGHAIPAVYADYVRTGFERGMDTVLYHNAADLVTLFDLALRLAA